MEGTGKAQRGMTAADLFRLSLLSDAQVSPDGSRVAYVCTRLDEEEDAYLANIWVVPVYGGEPRRFTAGKKRDTAPRWSPDGRWLAFLSERDDDKHAQLFVMPADGGEARRLTGQKTAVEEPVWSPDSTRIAFAAYTTPEEDEPDDDKDGGKSRPARVITTLRYKANGEGFVHDRRRHLFIVSLRASQTAPGGPWSAAQGATAQPLGWHGASQTSYEEAQPRQITDGDWNDGTPSWSPDGTRLVFDSARHEERDYDYVSDLWIVPAEGGEARRITPGRGPCSYPAWSPSGSLIAYTGNEYALDMGRNNRVYVVPSEGGEPRCLTEQLDRTCTPFAGAIGPLWSPDGRFIYFGVEDRGTVPVYRVPADGSAPPESAVPAEARQLTGLSVANDGTFAFCAKDPLSPAEVAVRGPDGVERRLTDANRAFKDEVELVQPEHFSYTRAGFTLDGWVMRPAGYEPGRRYPALLDVHGGPATQYGYDFFDEFQVQAGAGYAVIYTNPRGSQGYGEAFTRAVRADWGGGDYDDMMLALDEALRRFDFIDPERLGVLGGSYGGYMTSWIVGHTDRFKVACSERAVNNLYTLFGTSDIGSTFCETHAGVRPWEDLQWFVDHSPLTYAPRITTPLLILHSEDDLRCPIEQAEQLFVVLKKLHREVLFIRIPQENHELSRSGKPRHRRDRFGYILDWLHRHLQPERAVEPGQKPTNQTETSGAASNTSAGARSSRPKPG